MLRNHRIAFLGGIRYGTKRFGTSKEIYEYAVPGKAIFKPLNTGRIDEHGSCVREWIANIFFYTKNGTTIMIDAGYNYARLQEKMGWLDLDPATIRHILITHQDTDHVGALERDSELLFKDAMGISWRSKTVPDRRGQAKVFQGAYSFRWSKRIPKTLQKTAKCSISDIQIECILSPAYLGPPGLPDRLRVPFFTGDTSGTCGGRRLHLHRTLAEANKLAAQPLESRENLRARYQPIKDHDRTYRRTEDWTLPSA